MQAPEPQSTGVMHVLATWLGSQVLSRDPGIYQRHDRKASPVHVSQVDQEAPAKKLGVGHANGHSAGWVERVHEAADERQQQDSAGGWERSSLQQEWFHDPGVLVAGIADADGFTTLQARSRSHHLKKSCMRTPRRAASAPCKTSAQTCTQMDKSACCTA